MSSHLGNIGLENDENVKTGFGIEARQPANEGQGSHKYNTHLEDEIYKKSNDDSFDSVSYCVKDELISQLVFENIEDAGNFYFAYAKAEGFDVRKQSVQVSGDLIKNRVWVCTRQGFRKEKKEGKFRARESKALTRCGCRANFRVSHDRYSGRYVVSRFTSNHNHSLDGSKKRYMSISDKSMLSMMTDIGYRPSEVMNYLEQLAGGAGKLSFRRKDGYNYLNKLRSERIQGGDVNTVMKFLETKKLNDEKFIYKYTVDKENSLTRLFWCDGTSQAEYEVFGDTLVFDSTYKTNTYLYPLVIFSGFNNHGSTCIFGAAVIWNETIETYRWLLQAFREAMNRKIPESVLTDQDASMRAAISSEFPGARHRICSWHLCRNVRDHVKNSNFCNGFSSLMRRRCSIEEFESSWSNLVEQHNLSNHKWVVDIYKKRELWAEAYFRGHFMSLMTTTQLAESVNSLIKLSVDQRMSLIDFISHYHRTLQRVRYNFINTQEDAEKDKPPVRETPLKSLEEHAFKLCTKKIYLLIRQEIYAEQGVVLENRSKDDGLDIFILAEYDENDTASYYKVTTDSTTFHCDCFMLESDGLPCRHIIFALWYLRIKKFPENMIHRRWLIETGSTLKKKFPFPTPLADSQQIRFGLMNKECLSLAFIASQGEYGFENSLKRVRELVHCVEKENLTNSQHNNISSQKTALRESVTSYEGVRDPKLHKSSDNVHDPARINTRGATRAKKHKCGLCGEPGHKATTCTKDHANSKRQKKTRVTKSSSIKDKSTDVHNSTQNPEAPSHEHVQRDNNGNAQQNNYDYSFYSDIPYPMTCNTSHNLFPPQTPILPSFMGSSNSGVDFGTFLRPMGHLQNVIPPGNFPYLYPNFSNDIHYRHSFRPPHPI